MMTTTETKRFPLSFKNAAEDVPRLITAYGKCGGSELGLVLRPGEGRGALIKIEKDRALAWWTGEKEQADAPKVPHLVVTPIEAIKRVKHEQTALQKAGPITLKGQWKGHLVCRDEGHHVELVRKISGYATLFVVGNNGQWRAIVNRDERWFGGKKEIRGTPSPTLKQAILDGLGLAFGVVSEACAVRDTTRRGSRDVEYQKNCGEKVTGNCVGPARERKDPLDRMKEPVEKRPRGTRTSARKAKPAEVTTRSVVSLGRRDAPVPLDAPVSLPALPTGTAEASQLATDLADAAEEIKRIQKVEWLVGELDEGESDLHILLDLGLDAIVSRIESYADGEYKLAGVDDLLEELLEDVGHFGLAPVPHQRAQAALQRLHDVLKASPHLVNRARWLIRYTLAAVQSNLCQERERTEAMVALKSAMAAYEQIRESVTKSGTLPSKELKKNLHTLSTGVGLAAAKLARSCARGQQSLTAQLAVKKNEVFLATPLPKGPPEKLPALSVSQPTQLLLPSAQQTSRFGRLFAKFLEDAGVFDRFAQVDRQDRDKAAITLKNPPWQDLAIEWVLTPHIGDWPMWKLSLAHYTEQNGDRFADLEGVFRVEGGQLKEHVFIRAGGRDVETSPDNELMKMWLNNLRDQGFVEAARRQLAVKEEATNSACACKLPRAESPKTATTPPVGNPDYDKKYGKLVIVPLYGTPKSAEELVPYLTGATSAYKAEPSIHLAKKWVKSACLRLSLDAVDIKGNNDGGIGVYVVHLSLKNNVTAPDVRAKLAMIHEAITLLGLSFRLMVGGEVTPTGDTTRASMPRRKQSTPVSQTDVPGSPPRSASRAKVQAKATEQGETAPDAAKDKLILDGIKGALGDLLGGL